jgi:hypothetical protein
MKEEFELGLTRMGGAIDTQMGHRRSAPINATLAAQSIGKLRVSPRRSFLRIESVLLADDSNTQLNNEME